MTTTPRGRAIGRPAAGAIELCAAVLPDLAQRVQVPAYDRTAVTPGIVHIGVGGFHRAHQAMYLDALMQGGEALDWGVVGVGVMPGDALMAEVLEAQDCLYTLLVKHPDGTVQPRVLGSLVDYLYAPDRPAEVLERMSDPATRIVSLTVTEGGWHVHQVSGEFDGSDAAIQRDLAAPDDPSTALGFVTEALARRRAAGVPPFTVMSCDNMQSNGDVARRMLVAFASLRDPGLGAWVDAEVAFPNSMVDRITPVTTDEDRALLAESFGVIDRWPVACEPFAQWALEERFPTGRPPFERAGVQVVADVTPYELMKLRLLNASHQAMAYLGYLAGHRHVHEVGADPLFADFLRGYMEREGVPTLPPIDGVDLASYRELLIERFANPAVRDTLARLCAESSDRIPQWLLPVVRERLAANGHVRRSALIVAAWARYAEGVDERGEPIEVVDRRREQVMARARRRPEDPLAFLRDPDLFGRLVEDPRFTQPYLAGLDLLRRDGAVATLEAWQDLSETPPPE